MGPYEASLVGNPVAVADKPLEVLRTVHSFDPCLACAIHLHDNRKKDPVKVRVL
jgi:hydrogenase large subunit